MARMKQWVDTRPSIAYFPCMDITMNNNNNTMITEMTTMINDWRPECRAILNRLVNAGFTLISAYDGEDVLTPNTIGEAVDFLTAVDEGWATFGTDDGFRSSIFLVWGNSPGEAPADWGCPKHPKTEVFDKALTEHFREWEGRKQPKQPRP